MPLSRNSRKVQKKKQPAKKQWKAAPSKPSATSAILKLLKKEHSDAHCELNFKNPFELLIATTLSAQCTDERVNMVTAVLFKKYPTAKALSLADLATVEDIVKSTGFYRAKAKNIVQASKRLVEKYGGEVPKDIDALVELPGVGRKTAKVVLGNAYDINAGIVVDTHVRRLSQRLGWTKNMDPDKIATDLEKIIPHDDWIMISHLLIFHGRRICKARNPACDQCFLFDLCPRKGVAK